MESRTILSLKEDRKRGGKRTNRKQIVKMVASKSITLIITLNLNLLKISQLRGRDGQIRK